MSNLRPTNAFRRTSAAVLLAVTLPLASCALTRGTPSVGPALGTARNELTLAPERITVAGQAYSLEVFLWRDFMLAPRGGGRPLQGTVRTNPLTFPPGRSGESLSIDRVWLVHVAEVWEAPQPLGGTALSRTFDGGPQWEPGTAVDVVARILDATSNQAYLLNVSGQPVQRTG
jgi:hypothetical protein